MEFKKYKYFAEFSLDRYNNNTCKELETNYGTVLAEPTKGTIVSIQQKQTQAGHSKTILIVGFNDDDVEVISNDNED